MNDDLAPTIIDPDPLDFMHGLIVGGVKNVSLIAASTLKGTRDGSLKNSFVKAIAKVAHEGKLHSESMNYTEQIGTYDEFNKIIEDIENNVDINKLQAKISLYLYSLTEDQKQRVTTARLMRTLNDLSLDAILVLKVLLNPDVDKARGKHDQGHYYDMIAAESGLGHHVYVARAVEELVKENLVTDRYLDRLDGPLTGLGNDLLSRIEKYPDLAAF